MGRLHRSAALIFAAAVIIAWGADARSERRVALVIGNNEYKQLDPLAKAVADAETYAALFRAKGFDQVTLRTNLTRGAMDEAIAAFVEGIEPGDTAVFSYAGHGWSDGTQNFIIGTDAPVGGSHEFLARISIPLRNGLSGVIDDMDRRGASLKVAIIDACRDNPFAPAPGKRGAGMTRGLARIDPPEGTFVIYSAAAQQSSLDRLSAADTNPNGIFTRVFAPLLARDMSLQDAVKEAQREVVSLARSIQEEQKPAYYDEVIGRACLTDACESSAPASAGAPAPDAETWTRIAGSSDPADFESFSRIFPDSPHRSEAEARAKALREAESTDVAVAAPPALSSKIPEAPPGDSDTVPTTECDRLAASEYSSGKPEDVQHVSLQALQTNASAAIAACREAVLAHPSEPRLLFQLGRALDAGGQTDEAKAWYAKAVDLGDLGAMNNLANHQRDTNPEEAVRLYRQAAEAGLAPAMINLGALYAGGTAGLAQSYEEARNWYLKAAELGDTQGMNSLANLFTTGSGGEVDLAAARAWYEKAAGLGDTEAMLSLAWFYESGDGVTQDYDAARNWYEKAADLGDRVAMTRIGEFFEAGTGVAADEREALRWYEKAAGLGWGTAMAHLGEFYERGKGGLAQDYAEARRWYQSAIDNNEAKPAATLGFMYATGVGGPKDNQLASKTLLFGMPYGYPEFFERLTTDADSLDPEVWRDIQNYLVQEGVLSGAADGEFGDETRAALDAYRKRYWGESMSPAR